MPPGWYQESSASILIEESFAVWLPNALPDVKKYDGLALRIRHLPFEILPPPKIWSQKAFFEMAFS